MTVTGQWQLPANDSYQLQCQMQLENLLHWIHKLEQKTFAYYHILQITRHIFWNVIPFRLISPSEISVPAHHHPIHLTLGATRCSSLAQHNLFCSLRETVKLQDWKLSQQCCCRFKLWDVTLCATFLPFWSVHSLSWHLLYVTSCYHGAACLGIWPSGLQ